jgi:hypothetical protein
VAGGQQPPFVPRPGLAAQEQVASVLAGDDLAEDGFDDGFAGR